VSKTVDDLIGSIIDRKVEVVDLTAPLTESAPVIQPPPGLAAPPGPEPEGAQPLDGPGRADRGLRVRDDRRRSRDGGGFDQPFPLHTFMQGAGKYNLTSLVGLGRLPATGAVLIVAPLPIVGGSGSPARVLALVAR
jgi:kynurenine formamidase